MGLQNNITFPMVMAFESQPPTAQSDSSATVIQYIKTAALSQNGIKEKCPNCQNLMANSALQPQLASAALATARQQILGAISDEDLITLFGEKNDSKNILIAKVVPDDFGKGTYGLNRTTVRYYVLVTVKLALQRLTSKPFIES
uniref:Uncharacterized protein n=1 Tax=Glossina pallidipes TaxID=7398 RepID=A0A1A9ZAM2_GLOPL